MIEEHKRTLKHYKQTQADELAAAEAKTEEVRQELATVEAERDAIQAELDETKAQLESAQADIAAAEAVAEAARAEIEQAEAEKAAAEAENAKVSASWHKEAQSYANAVKDFEEHLKLLDDQKRAMFVKLAKSIRIMARKRPSPGLKASPAEQKNVDLLQYISLCVGDDQRIPEDMLLGRFSCKGYVSQHKAFNFQTNQKEWVKRWLVLDLIAKNVILHTDDREFRVHAKGTIALVDIVDLQVTEDFEDSHCFEVFTKRRTFHLKAGSALSAKIWVQVFTSILPANHRKKAVASSGGSTPKKK